MKYLKVFTDFDRDMEKLTDEEKGRLFVAMLKYAEDQTEPDLPGPEKYIFCTAKKMIDGQIKSYQGKVAANQRIAENRSPRGKSGKSGKKNDHVVQEQEQEQEKEKNKKKDKKYKEPLDIAIDEFAAFRKEIKKPLTTRAMTMLRNRLEKLAPGDDAEKIAMLHQSIYRGWLDVYHVKPENRNAVTNNPFMKIYMEEGEK